MWILSPESTKIPKFQTCPAGLKSPRRPCAPTREERNVNVSPGAKLNEALNTLLLTFHQHLICSSLLCLRWVPEMDHVVSLPGRSCWVQLVCLCVRWQDLRGLVGFGFSPHQGGCRLVPSVCPSVRITQKLLAWFNETEWRGRPSAEEERVWTTEQIHDVFLPSELYEIGFIVPITTYKYSVDLHEQPVTF